MSQRDGAADKVPARIVEGHGVAVPCGFPQVIAAGAVERRLRGRGRDRKREQHCGERENADPNLPLMSMWSVFAAQHHLYKLTDHRHIAFMFAR